VSRPWSTGEREREVLGPGEEKEKFLGQDVKFAKTPLDFGILLFSMGCRQKLVSSGECQDGWRTFTPLLSIGWRERLAVRMSVRQRVGILLTSKNAKNAKCPWHYYILYFQ
jgi:hypothetical protein